MYTAVKVVLGFENALREINMIKNQSQCLSQSLLNFRHTEYSLLIMKTKTSVLEFAMTIYGKK